VGVRLIDFGFAKPPPERAVVVTRPGFTFGTPAYMAPELLKGEKPQARHDLWGVAVILFEMLSGVRPFGGSPLPDLQRVRRPLSACAPHVSAELVLLVERGLDSDPAKRFQTAGDFRRALSAVGEKLASQRPMLVRAAPTLPVLYEFDDESTGPESVESPT
jgi:serine/threonine-protein kinase